MSITITPIDFIIEADKLVPGMGTLLITDTSLIVDAKHPDAVRTFQSWKERANMLLQLGNDLGLYEIHTISPYSALASSQLLGRCLHHAHQRLL